MNNTRTALKSTIVDLVSLVSGLLTIGSVLKKATKILPRGNFNPKLNKTLKMISWCLTLIALIASIVIAPFIFYLGMLLDVNAYLTLLIAVSIPTAVIVPTVLQAKEDKILTAFVHQDLTK
ncbi:hypothetical protein [Sphingobacterium tabacisoli]|uniref:Uncharacterized protein n=1 Tax=Sphingobacterium tabacisoli TaxID=2044855 RepID=A0ABW5L1A5_9SPHI|nr:hypothetical protein [Sphingobacterium tabacisoli]